MEVVERRHRRELAVHRRGAPRRHAAGQHDHVLRRAAQPAREIPQLLRPHIGPVVTAQLHELREVPQITRIRPHRVRRTLDVRHPAEERLDRLDRPPVGSYDGPRLAAVLHDSLNPAAPLRSRHRHRTVSGLPNDTAYGTVKSRGSAPRGLRIQPRKSSLGHPGAGLSPRGMMVGAMEPDTAMQATEAAKRAVMRTRMGARQFASVLGRTAELLEHSATLAEQHARRRERAGRDDAAAEERDAARRARETAVRARALAEEWLKMLEEREG